jgi:four helix bundle protein
MNAEELKARTKKFALRILKLVAALPNNLQGKTIGGQLVRSGTSVAANYRAACRGRSKAEFIAKLGVVEEEADESAFWLELIIDSGLLQEEKARSLLQEANELTKIMASSRISAKEPKATTGFDLPSGGLSLEQVEKDLILQAMQRTGNNITRAAKLVGLSFRTMQYRLEKLKKTENSAQQSTVVSNRQSAIGNRQ